MKWQEVRDIYPNQFVKFEILHSEEMDNQEKIDEVAELFKCKLITGIGSYSQRLLFF